MMEKLRHPSHVALYDSSYVILFHDGSWSSQGLSNKLTRRMNWSEYNIQFVTLGPDRQWFFRLINGEAFFNLKDDNLRDELENSTVLPYKLWFYADDGYILQYEDLSLVWKNIPYNLHKKLIGRQKSLPKVKHITFGPRNTWWVSFQDGTAYWSSNLPSYIAEHLMQTECLVLDPIDKNNYFIFEKNDHFKWRVDDYFDDCMVDSDESDEDDESDQSDESDENDDVAYIDPQRIRYTETSINHQFANGQSIDQLRYDLQHGITTVSEIPMIDVIKTRRNNFWSLDNRRLWCFRHALNISKIPVRILERPSWFNERIQQLKNPFDIRVRDSLEETEFHSDISKRTPIE